MKIVILLLTFAFLTTTGCNKSDNETEQNSIKKDTVIDAYERQENKEVERDTLKRDTVNDAYERQENKQVEKDTMKIDKK